MDRRTVAAAMVPIIGVLNGCGDGDAAEASGSVLGATVDPKAVSPGSTFRLSFPPGTEIGRDFVLRRGGRPMYVLSVGVAGSTPRAAPVHDGVVFTHPALIVSDGDRLEVELLLPADAAQGDELCSPDSDECDELPVDR